jgi:leucyl/phenylalanyl-tRNA--protein transferase
MPLYQLTTDLVFPSPELAEREGLLAVGGDLTVERLLLAYSVGIFPWFGDGDPILWWSPDPRMVLFPNDFHASARLRRLHRQRRYRVTLDTAFPKVIAACADQPRPGQDGTWITGEMEEAYTQLHWTGFAHSVEVWDGARLAGGLYGVSLGAAFFGESMFSLDPNTSKLAMWTLVEQIKRWGFHFIDCQVHTPHLESLGGNDIPRRRFLKLLKDAVAQPTRRGPWQFDADLPESMD